jgi:hypothetical protein
MSCLIEAFFGARDIATMPPKRPRCTADPAMGDRDYEAAVQPFIEAARFETLERMPLAKDFIDGREWLGVRDTAVDVRDTSNSIRSSISSFVYSYVRFFLRMFRSSGT